MEHDLIHGVWHIDKGVLFTVKELILRPGDSVRGFIQGKRVGFFSFDPDYSYWIFQVYYPVCESPFIGHHALEQ